MGFNRRKMDQRREAAEKEAAGDCQRTFRRPEKGHST
jgi:hypothetical protein